MYQTITNADFHQAFRNYRRDDQFSVEARDALFAWLEELEACSEEPMELDVIGLCCDFTEYDSATEAAHEYRNIYSPPDRYEDESYEEYEERCEEGALEWLQDRTVVIECDNGHVIIQAF